MQPGPENNGSFPAQLYFTGPSILCRAEISSCGRGLGVRETERGGAGEQRLALADELTRSGGGVTGLFWLRRKPRSRERKWLLCLCVFLYIDTPRLPHASKPGSNWLQAGCRTEGRVAKGQITAGGTGGAEQPRSGESFWYHVVAALFFSSSQTTNKSAIPRAPSPSFCRTTISSCKGVAMDATAVPIQGKEIREDQHLESERLSLIVIRLAHLSIFLDIGPAADLLLSEHAFPHL